MSGETILIAEDDGAMRTVLQRALARAGYAVRTTGNAAGLWRWVAQGEGDLVLSDVMLPDENVFELLPRIQKHRPGLPIVVMSAQNTLMTAITAAERGAYEYLPKPFDLDELVAVLGRALAEPRKTQATRRAPQEEELPLIGRSAAMQDIYRVMARLMQSDLAVLITGQTGTGKELVARALHDFGQRRNNAFVAINMAAIPRDLIEAEMFGHEKGAFTGAARRGTGRFEQAEGGTLFLDEIGDMPMEAQTRLLRVLQEGEYTSVGGTAAVKTDVRIIAATNRDLSQRVEQGLFREDLFYRLNVVPIRLPPLRDRSDDIPDLVRHFLKSMTPEGGQAREIGPGVFEVLQRHPWPGNVRELENLIRRLVTLHPRDTLTAELVEAELAGGHSAPNVDIDEEDDDLAAAAERYFDRYFRGYAPGLPPEGVYDTMLAQIEHPLITACLTACGGNQVKTAKLLGLNRNTLRKKIAHHDIQFPPKIK